MALPTTAVHCDANAGSHITSFGWTFDPCETRIGLRSYTDSQGTLRHYCAALGHERNVRRRFGAAESCYLCRKPTDDMAIVVNLGRDRLGLMCFRCQDDLEPLTVQETDGWILTADRSPS